MIKRTSLNRSVNKCLITCLVMLVVLLTAGSIHSQIVLDRFSALVAPSTDYALHDRWYNTLGETAPKLRTTRQVTRDQVFGLYLFVVGYALDSTGRADVIYDCSIKDTSGKEVYSFKDAIALDMKIDNPKNLMMSKTTPFVTFESEHELGEYTIDFEVRDRVSGETAEASDSLKLVAYKPAETPNEFASGDWFTFYYRNPEPEALVNSLISFVTGEMYEKAAAPINGFFVGAFEQNPQLIPYLIKKIPDQKKKYRKRIEKVLGTLSLTGPGIQQMNVAEKLRKDLSKYKGLDVLKPEEEISDPGQLDYLWGRFFATGYYEPIRRIVSALNLAPYLQYVDEKQKDSWSHKPSNDDVMKGAVCSAALWSLGANAQQHPSVRNYLHYMMVAGDLTDNESRLLGALFKK